MTDTITPALSAEEWAARRAGATDIYSTFVAADSPDEFFYLIACLNDHMPDSDPRKITRDQVDALADVADKATVRHWHDAHYAAPHIRALVAALRALLPP
jgi:hypothetical protein